MAYAIAETLNLPPGAPLLLIFFAVAAVMLTLRYLVFAGGGLALLYVFQRQLKRFRIQNREFSRAQLLEEARASAATILIFAAVIVSAAALHRHTPIFAIYREIDVYGPVWLVVSVPVAILVHDFYFYWAHRFMHLGGVYERVHAVHHRSTNPSPLAAFAFHPIEALIEAGGFLVVAMLVPLHPIAFAIVAMLMFVFNVVGHSSHELFPARWRDHPVLGWLNTATSHNQHHRSYSYNFGLYTLIWDRMFGTLHPGYEALFDQAARGVTGQASDVDPDSTASKSKS